MSKFAGPGCFAKDIRTLFKGKVALTWDGDLLTFNLKSLVYAVIAARDYEPKSGGKISSDLLVSAIPIDVRGTYELGWPDIEVESRTLLAVNLAKSDLNKQYLPRIGYWREESI